MTRALRVRSLEVIRGSSKETRTVNHLDIALFPDLVEESLRELDRERERRRQIREALSARRVDRPSRFATLTARLRRALQRNPSRPVVEGC
jgi:hypothetical protein